MLAATGISVSAGSIVPLLFVSSAIAKAVVPGHPAFLRTRYTSRWPLSAGVGLTAGSVAITDVSTIAGAVQSAGSAGQPETSRVASVRSIVTPCAECCHAETSPLSRIEWHFTQTAAPTE